MTPLLAICALLGADPPPKPPLRVPTVVVSGRRFIEDEAAPSTVIDRRTIEEDAVADLPELLDDQPGLRTSRLGGLGAFSSVSIRGSTPDQVLILIDGIPLNTGDGGSVDLSTIPLGPVDAVITYRGVTPVTALGSAIGGAVSVHTRRLTSHRLEVQAGGGSFGTRSARAFYGTGGKRWGMGLAVDYLGSEGDFGYVNDQGTLLGRGGSSDDTRVDRANNVFNQVSALAKGRFDFTEDLSLHLLEFFTWRRAGLPGLGTTPTHQANTEGLRSLTGLRLVWDKPFDHAGQITLTPYVVWARAQLHDPLAEVGLGRDDTRDHSLVQGTNLSWRVPFSLTADSRYIVSFAGAVGWRYEQFKPGGASQRGVSDPAERQLLVGAGEVSALFDPADLELVFSVRGEGAFSHGGGQPAGDASGQTVSQGAFTWRAALVQWSIPQTQLKLNVARAVRFPSLFELYGNTGLVLGNPDLSPEVGLNVDIGVVHSADWLGPGDTLSFELFTFMNQVDSLIQFVQNSQGVAVAHNVDSAFLLGVEFGTYLDVLEHLRIRGAFTWMRTRDSSDIKGRNGNQLPGRPEFTVFARLEGYHRFQTGGIELGASFETEYLAGSFLDFANLVEVPQRVLLGASVWASFLHNQLKANVTAQNLLDDRVQDLAGFPLPGLTVMASLRWSPRLAPREEPEPAALPLPQPIPEAP